MQFDMCHASSPAALWAPAFVVASIAWAGVLAHLLFLSRNAGRPNWKSVALLTLASPVIVKLITPEIDLSDSSCAVGYYGRGVWMAIPLAIPFVALRLLKPLADAVSIAAHSVAGLACLHGWWTVSLFPEDVVWEVGPKGLLGLEAKVAPAPWVALLGAAIVLLVQVTMTRGAAPSSWRAWVTARLQMLVAVVALVF